MLHSCTVSLHRALILLPLLLCAACGASYQYVYEGDVRFEHCYRLDADPSINSQTRLACWSEWTRGHTAGQTLDRVDYARRREAALRSGDPTPQGPTLLTGRTPAVTSQTFALNARPTPTAGTATSTPDAGSAPSALTSQQECAQACGVTFTQCVTRCDQTPCAQKCGNQVKVCLDHCL